MTSSQHVSICIHTCFQSLTSLFDGRVSNAVLQTVPDVNEVLFQLIDTVHVTFIHFLLHNTQDLI